MTIESLFVILVLVAVFLYVVDAILPVDAKTKKIINVVVLVLVFLYLLKAFGVIGGSPIRLR